MFIASRGKNVSHGTLDPGGSSKS